MASGRTFLIRTDNSYFVPCFRQDVGQGLKALGKDAIIITDE